MRALMYYGPNDMKVVELPEPSPSDRQVKLRIHYVGICGSDVHGYLGITGRRIPPMIMGHEFSAVVIETGKDVVRFKIGDRVTALPILSCGHCPNCKTGAINACDNRAFMGVMDVNGMFAEYVCCDESLLYKLPETLDDKVGALVEPFAVAYHAVKKVLPLEGKNVMIVGAGPIGILVLAVARYFGARTIVISDLSDKRLENAKRFGADIMVNPKRNDIGLVLEAEGIRNSVDAAFEVVGIGPAAQQSINYVRNRGIAVWVGNSAQMIEINMQNVVTREVSILGSYLYVEDDYIDSIKLLGSSKLDIEGFISEIIGLDEAENVFKKLSEGDTSKLKVLVDMRQ